MKLLLVEDDLHFAETFAAAVGEHELAIAESRDSAIRELAGSKRFDVVICDLRIPSADAAMDEAIEHGVYVYQEALRLRPGVPIVILSAYRTEDPVELAQELLRATHQADRYGGGMRPMVESFQKTHVSDCVRWVQREAAELEKLAAIELASGPVSLELDEYEMRAIQIYVRRRGGVLARITELTGGLSGARTLLVRVSDSFGHIVSTVVAKVGPRDVVMRERSHYDDHLPGRLTDPRAFPAFAGEVLCGAGDVGAVFYQLAEPYRKTLFDVLLDDVVATQVVTELRLYQEPWLHHGNHEAVRVGDIRRSLLSDDELTPTELDAVRSRIDRVETLGVQVRKCIQHGDLHGANILVTESGEALMIDFACTGPAPAALDPVTLELSILFHPSAPSELQEWATPARARSWVTLEDYLVNCPIPSFLTACRSWAHDVAAGDREVYAVAYALAERHLKFGDAAREQARSIIEATIEALGP